MAVRGNAGEVAFEGFVGTGQMSRNARLRLTWDADPDGRPTSFVGKFPSDDEAAPNVNQPSIPGNSAGPTNVISVESQTTQAR